MPDYFVWEAFDRASSDPARQLKPDASQQEALLAETENFFVIPDQFGVVSGHVLVIPKRPSTSIAGLDGNSDDELVWLLAHVSTLIAEAYGAQAIVAEHGECGCATAKQAHVHIIPAPANVTPADLRGVIDTVLQRRMVGIERIIYRDLEFTALEDLQMLIDADGATVVGRQMRTDDLAGAVDYPAAARFKPPLTEPYVYFTGPGLRLFSRCNVGSQFVREIVARASGLPAGTWDRRVNTSRHNMFSTYTQLSSPFRESVAANHGFRSRVGM